MLTIYPSTVLEKKIFIPSSKSHTLRSILCASLAKGTSTIIQYLESPDTQAMIHACQAMGAIIDVKKGQINIIGNEGNIDFSSFMIDAQNSGQVFRFIAAISAAGNKIVTFSGDNSIQKRRPILPLLNALKQLGVEVSVDPIQIKGPVTSFRAVLDGQDSQPVSAMIFLGALLNHPLEVRVQNPGETPWIDVTLSWLKRCSLSYEKQGYEEYTIYGKKGWNSFEYCVPGDWSSATFWIILALISQTKLILENLDYKDVQGDKKILFFLEQMGAQFCIEKNRVTIFPSGKLKGGIIDLNDCIDAVPIFSVLGCFLCSKLILKNVKIARLKESDRLQAMTQELRKMQAHMDAYEDALIIYPSSLKGSVVDAHKDHRIAMALTIAAICAEGQTVLQGEDCVQKSYPHFFTEIKRLGVKVEQLDFDRV